LLFYYFAILLVVVSNVFYQISQKLIPSDVNPVLSLIVTYSTAIIFSLFLLPFYPITEGFRASFRKMNWASFTLGITIVGIELGFLLAFRAGWNISFAQLFSGLSIAVLLIPIGVLFFHDKLTVLNVIGILLSIGGLILMSYKR
jgi:drug/metabolite transporter (DMT)-like permease